MRTIPVAVAFLLILGGATAAPAAVYNVNSEIDAADANFGDGVCLSEAGDCTLRAAIQQANAVAGADQINLPAGIYELTLVGAGEGAAATGDLDIRGDLTLVGAGRDETFVDGASADRVFDHQTGVVSISGLTIQAGVAPAGERGGGINVASTAASLSLFGARVTMNQAFGGGGIHVGSNFALAAPGAPLTLNDVQITDNQAEMWGGGIQYAGAAASWIYVTVDGNSTMDPSPFRGGGGIYFDGLFVTSTPDVTITKSTISHNSTAAEGGGMHASSPHDVFMTNVTISGNSAGISGGGVFGNVDRYRNATITNNTAPVGAGLGGVGASSLLENSIVAANIGADCDNPVTTGANNLESGTSCGFTHAQDLQNTDPLLQPLSFTGGGFTRTHPLTFESPAIDWILPVYPCPATDQRDNPRPVDGDSNGFAFCDIGAYEISPVTCAPVASRGGALHRSEWAVLMLYCGAVGALASGRFRRGKR